MTTAPAKQPQSVDLVEDVIRPHARQREFLSLIPDHTYLLYGGAAGGGKSYILRWALVMLLITWFQRLKIREIRVGLFCEDYPTLKDRQISKIRKEMPPWLGGLKESQLEGLGFYLHARWGGGAIMLRNLDEPSKYMSTEFAAVGIDELTRNEFEVFEVLAGIRLRWPGIEDTKFLGASNPGQIGHAWVKQLFVDRDFTGDFAELRPKAAEFAYLPARATDNPYNSQSYIAKLMTLRPALRTMYLEGNWDAFEGQMFAEFHRDVHTRRPFRIPDHWRRWIANDPGYIDPAVWVFLAADEEGTVYVYRVLTLSRDLTPERAAPTDQARAVQAARRWTDEKGVARVDDVDFVVTGHDAFAKDPETHKARVDYYREQGLGPIEQAAVRSGSRKERAVIVHEYLKPYPHPTEPDRMTARLQIFDDCVELIRTLPALPCDDHEPEAVADCSADHWYDALSYGLQAWHARRSSAPKPSAKPGTMAAVLKHADVFKPKVTSGNLLRR